MGDAYAAAIMGATYRSVGAGGTDLLSEAVRGVCFVAVQRPRTSLAVRMTCIAVAGTLGAMGLFGHRRGGVGAMFADGGRRLAPDASPWGGAVAGLLIHVVWIAVWSALFAALMQRGRRPGASIHALLVAGLALGASFLLPDGLVGPVATLPTPERMLVHLVLGVSFALGMRLAPAG